MKAHKAYLEYLQQLWDYLSRFLFRIQPLIDQTELIAKEWDSAYISQQQSSKKVTEGSSYSNSSVSSSKQ